ncbi:MAG: DUF3084 domain-containing protein [Candidatus Eremiobacteraeota bacterium]|nr:DUF3084 domain-containing protein [Candidatus Eremiobacteraeota bacterium]
MLSLLPGILGVIGIAVVAGIIAYIGDRVGHQIGRKRLTLFGLRPKYTSTIVAVATGMLIALSVTVLALVVSNQVRTAFFRLGQLTSQINALQAQAVAQEQELNTTRNGAIAMARGTLIGPGIVMDQTQTEDQQLRVFASYFDETVRVVNQNAARLGLQPSKSRSSDPKVRGDLLTVLRAAHDHWSSMGEGRVPLLFLPIARRNLFRGEPIDFTFGSWTDTRLFSDGQAVASIDVEGGRAVTQPDYALLQSRAFNALAKAGMPYPFFAFPSGFDPTRVEAVVAQLARVRGHFRITARSEGDLYPHLGQFTLGVTLDSRR